jgi:hypothetical protein
LAFPRRFAIMRAKRRHETPFGESPCVA